MDRTACTESQCLYKGVLYLICYDSILSMYLILIPPTLMSLSLSLSHIHTYNNTCICMCVCVYNVCVYRPIYTRCEFNCGCQSITYKITNLHDLMRRLRYHSTSYRKIVTPLNNKRNSVLRCAIPVVCLNYKVR